MRPIDPGGLLTERRRIARPAVWFIAGLDAAERGEFGPADLAEMLDDAVDVAIHDQEDAGIEVVSDGEMRRAGSSRPSSIAISTGVRTLPPGAPDRAPAATTSSIASRSSSRSRRPMARGRRRVPLRRHPAKRPLKVTVPGPYTLSGCAANWGLFHDRFGKERITIYELVDPPADGEFAPCPPDVRVRLHRPRALRPAGHRPCPTMRHAEPFGGPVEVPVRPHLGVMGVAPEGCERLSSIPPGVFGGNVDN